MEQQAEIGQGKILYALKTGMELGHLIKDCEGDVCYDRVLMPTGQGKVGHLHLWLMHVSQAWEIHSMLTSSGTGRLTAPLRYRWWQVSHLNSYNHRI